MNDPTTRPSPPGDFPRSPREKPGYRLVFEDDFDGDALDRAKWLPLYLPHWSTPERSAPRLSVGGGRLSLRIDEDQAPWNPAFDGDLRVSSLQTGHFSGPLGSTAGQLHFKPGLTVRHVHPPERLFTPRHGFFEVRLRPLPLPGYMVAFWMIGLAERPEESGEICVCEIFGDETTATTLVSGSGLHPFGDPALRDEFHKDELPLDPSAFHVFAAEWTPEGVTFLADGRPIRTIPQSPTYPMQFMLNIYELPDRLPPGGRSGPWPKVFEVDYVRGYERTGDGPAR